MAQAQIRTLRLDNGSIQTEITPDIGGRLLSFSLAGKANFLKLGGAVVSNPDPAVNPESDNVFYLGHEIWAGPQSQWWTHQNINLKRAAEKADWPPDPYLILAKNTVLEQSAQKIVLQNPPSPISGLQLTKTYALPADKKNSLQLSVSAKNVRSEDIAWDLWFNTRTSSDTQIYAPVADQHDVRVKRFGDDAIAPLLFSIKDKIFSLDMPPLPKDKRGRMGKLMLQPAHGWLAGFRGGQVFIIQFPHQALSAIHPEQGQIELFSASEPGNPDQGLLEMEVHAPYQKLAPGASMQAQETWTILEYKGAVNREAQLAFLRQHAAALGLAGL